MREREQGDNERQKKLRITSWNPRTKFKETRTKESQNTKGEL